jgi:hypothetical protein
MISEKSIRKVLIAVAVGMIGLLQCSGISEAEERDACSVVFEQLLGPNITVFKIQGIVVDYANRQVTYVLLPEGQGILVLTPQRRLGAITAERAMLLQFGDQLAAVLSADDQKRSAA